MAYPKLNRKCSEEGCGRRHFGRGMCSMHYKRLRRAESGIRRPTTPERFWSKVQITSREECWPWSGTKAGIGYGYFSAGSGPMIGAHRYVLLSRGVRIPDGMFVCHRCDNPACCNPRHLYLGTPKDNTHDMIARGRHWSQKEAE
jgi:hypothetical protein